MLNGNFPMGRRKINAGPFPLQRMFLGVPTFLGVGFGRYWGILDYFVMLGVREQAVRGLTRFRALRMLSNGLTHPIRPLSVHSGAHCGD